MTTQSDSNQRHNDSHRYMNVAALFRPLTKWASPTIYAAELPKMVREAYKNATTKSPDAGPI